MEIKTAIIITLILMYLQLLINYFRWKMTAGKMEKTIHGLTDSLGREIEKNWKAKEKQNGKDVSIENNDYKITFQVTADEKGEEIQKKLNVATKYLRQIERSTMWKKVDPEKISKIEDVQDFMNSALMFKIMPAPKIKGFGDLSSPGFYLKPLGEVSEPDQKEFPGLKKDKAVEGLQNAGEALKKRKWNSFEGYEPEWKAAGFKSEEEWMQFIKENA
jgi:hypothetical protein